MELHAGALPPVLATDRDELTGLVRTGSFQAALDARCRGPGPAGGRDEAFTVGLVDIVGLRHVNRDFGDEAGDELLRQVADRLVRSGFAELVARVGDDEFALLAEGVGRAEGGQWTRALRRIVLQGPFRVDGQDISVDFHVIRRAGPPAPGRDLFWQLEREAFLDDTRQLWHRIDALQQSVTEMMALMHENRWLRANVETLRDLAMRDPLTRLLNRRGMTERLETLPAPRALAFVDLDDLSLLNSLDELWEDGDAAIIGLADRLREAFGRENVARWGGDEYLVASAGTPGDTAGVLTNVLAQCRTDLIVSGRPITFSAGVSGVAEGLKVARESAQRALKRAKSTRAAVVLGE